MRKLLVGIAALGLATAPAAARAGAVVELSAGVGSQLQPSVARAPTSVMIAPGWSFASVLKLELGLAAALGDVRNARADVELRPMVVVSPPLFPLYLRGVLAVQNLANGPTQVAYGGAVGLSFGVPLAGLGLFAEVGLLPRNVTIDLQSGAPVVGSTANATKDEFRWFAEGRLGAYYEF
jgi:hypothetical protein